MDKDLQNLINRFKDFPVIERKPSFLEIAGFPSRETVWRNIFAFFFDPNECHGLKDLLLRSFFDALGKQDQSTGDFDSMELSTECQTEKGNFLDLLITSNEFAIGIEMKVNAGLYNDLEDYGKLIKSHASTGTTFKVVLSKGSFNPDHGFKNLRYAELIAAIKQQLGNYVLAADPKYTSLLLDFLSHIINYIGGYAMTIDTKQLKFMQENHKTIKRLIATHNEIHRRLVERMCQIHDALANSLKPLIRNRNRLFSWEGATLSKIQFAANDILFWYQIGITSNYSIWASYFIDPNQSENQYLDNELVAEGFVPKEFDFSQPVEEVVADIETTILKMVDYLKKKQTAATGQQSITAHHPLDEISQ